ncbi:hypothetical protein, partial [Mesorhizobium sp. M4B.F.Ca.ET.150.01.1.1]|uniref:hypothetical protein n=1 Tax=Mesorhizobium sp. M4B.F.Ca.ET.150.01.1.1 TaxID=2563948 RepID=UPI001AEE0C9D
MKQLLDFAFAQLTVWPECRSGLLPLLLYVLHPYARNGSLVIAGRQVLARLAIVSDCLIESGEGSPQLCEISIKDNADVIAGTVLECRW